MDILEIRRENLRRWVTENGIPQKEKSYFSQLQAGGSFGERAARRLERDYRMGEGYLDRPLDLSREKDEVERERRHGPREAPQNRSGIIVYDLGDDVPDDMVLVPESRIQFAAGDGHINYELVEDEEPATYRRSWFQKHGINPDHVRRFRVTGNSMEPLLFPRDTILVNQDETQVVDGRLYALRYGDQLRVKYLSRRLDGTLVLRSVNPAYKDEEVPAELANEHITVIGRVRDRSGTGGL